MAQNQNFLAGVNKPALAKSMIIGAAIGLLFITLFLFGVNGKVEWGQYWKIRPMLMVPFAGAIGGLCFYVLNYFRSLFGWNKFVIYFISLIIFVIGLWMGTVLGLVGTLWN